MRTFFLSAIAILCTPSFAAAEAYASAFGGISLATDRFSNQITDFDDTNTTDGFLIPEVIGFDSSGNAILTSQPDFGISPIFGGAIGYEFSLTPKSFFQIELEGVHRRHRDNTIGPELFAEEVEITSAVTVLVGASSTTSRFVNTSGMLNIKLGREVSDSLFPYIGGGVGITSLNYSIDQTSYLEIGDFRIPLLQNASGNRDVFSWQAIGGAKLKLTSRLAIFAEGRFFQTEKFGVDAPFREIGPSEFIGAGPPPPIGNSGGSAAPGFPTTAKFSSVEILFGVSIALN